ncbi:hypothetical protein ACIRD6_36125 [Streptomyces sp. NPDC102473]|uniref:hypothetical protein n=1 Tax=Streptomyces sp. NPDC102473 TaxID=3366180 RepID=UPI003816DA86
MGILLQAPSEENGDRAMDLFEVLLEKAGDGVHNLTLTVQGFDGTAFAQFFFAQGQFGFSAREEQGLTFCHLLAVAVSGAHHSGLVMRSVGTETEGVCGWRFSGGDPQPLTRAEVFDAYCHNPVSGEITAPEPDVEYNDAPVIHL